MCIRDRYYSDACSGMAYVTRFLVRLQRWTADSTYLKTTLYKGVQFLCTLILNGYINKFINTYLYGFSGSWVFIWFFKVPLSGYPLPHTVHNHGLASEWWLQWRRNSDLFVYVLGHKSQLNELSASWPFICAMYVLLYTNDFSHSVQENGFAPVWSVLCKSRLCIDLNLSLIHI